MDTLRMQFALEKTVRDMLAGDPEGYVYLPELIRGLGFDDDPLPIWELLAGSAHGGGLELHTASMKPGITVPPKDRPLVPVASWSSEPPPCLVSMPSTAKPTRPLRPNGSSELRGGDPVFQLARGPFGTAAQIYGVVVEKKGQLRVQITGSASMVGASVGGTKTYPADGSWIWSRDPMLGITERRRDATKALKLATQAVEQGVGKRESRADAEALGMRPIRESDLRKGLTVYLFPDGGQPTAMTVHEVSEYKGEKEFTYLDEDGTELTSGHLDPYWVKA